MPVRNTVSIVRIRPVAIRVAGGNHPAIDRTLVGQGCHRGDHINISATRPRKQMVERAVKSQRPAVAGAPEPRKSHGRAAVPPSVPSRELFKMRVVAPEEIAEGAQVFRHDAERVLAIYTTLPTVSVKPFRFRKQLLPVQLDSRERWRHR